MKINSPNYRQCLRCVMDTTDPLITFDENGHCNHCNTYLRLRPVYAYKGESTDKQLQNILEQVKNYGKGKEYDCLVGLSGGVDSSYVAYQAKKMGLRPLIVHFDNGWNSELAIKNIENIVKKLQFDYQTYVIDWEEFKDVQRSFFEASLENLEVPTDHAIIASLYKIALQYNIKYILSGSNFATEGILPASWGYDAKDLTHLKAVHSRFGKVKLRSFPTLSFPQELYYTFVKGIKLIKLLNYVPYVKKDAMKVLETELNWVYYGGKHYESTFTRFFQAWYLPQKFDIDKRKAHLSTLICAGEITREEALAELAKPLYEPVKLETDKDYVLKKLGFTASDFEKIMKLPPKHYTDYPNNEKMKKIFYKIYNFVRH